MIGLGSRRSWGEKFKSAIIEIFFRGLSLFKGQRDFMVDKEEYKRGVFFLLMEDITIYSYGEWNDPVTKKTDEAAERG